MFLRVVNDILERVLDKFVRLRVWVLKVESLREKMDDGVPVGRTRD